MRLDWSSLVPNPWFQLCALVAVLSGGTTIYNLTQHEKNITGGNAATTPAPHSAPISINTPPPPPVLKAKVRGKWILDANGAPDSDSRELRAVVANLADGDVVTIRPGTYEGGVVIAKSARFIGAGANAKATVIRTAARHNVTVSAPNVAFENLTLFLESGGDMLSALNCLGASRTELDRCVLDSRARFAAFASDTAVVNARDCTFQSSNAGCAAKYTNNSRGELTRCTFTANRFGPQAMNSAQLKITASTFAGNGVANLLGNVLAVSGGQARLEVSQCQFNGNASALLANEGGTLIVNNSRFRDNGVTGEKGNVSNGLINISSAGKATLTNLIFENNRQGVQITRGATATISNCRLLQTGYRTDNEDIIFLCNAIAATGQNTSVTVNQNSVISGSALNAFVVAEGAKLVLEDVGIEKSGNYGLGVGNNVGAGTAEVRRAVFSGNGWGAVVNKGSSARFNNCQFIDSKNSGVWAGGADASASLYDCALLRTKGVGLFVQDGSGALAQNCTFEGNEYGAQAGIPQKAEQAGELSLYDCSFNQQIKNGVAICAGSKLHHRNLRFPKGKNQGLYTDKTASVFKDDYLR